MYTDAEVKSAFICNFAKFVYWPENAFNDDTSSVVIGILGDDPFGKTIDIIARSAKVNQRNVVVKRYKNIKETQGCHILYIGNMTQEKTLFDLLNKELPTAVLTVGQQEEFCKQGGMINFTGKPVKYGFEINVTALKNANLGVSSKLLKLAQITNSE